MKSLVFGIINCRLISSTNVDSNPYLDYSDVFGIATYKRVNIETSMGLIVDSIDFIDKECDQAMFN